MRTFAIISEKDLEPNVPVVSDVICTKQTQKMKLFKMPRQKPETNTFRRIQMLLIQILLLDQNQLYTN